jgi:hypothetical protein
MSNKYILKVFSIFRYLGNANHLTPVRKSIKKTANDGEDVCWGRVVAGNPFNLWVHMKISAATM